MLITGPVLTLVHCTELGPSTTPLIFFFMKKEVQPKQTLGCALVLRLATICISFFFLPFIGNLLDGTQRNGICSFGFVFTHVSSFEGSETLVLSYP